MMTYVNTTQEHNMNATATHRQTIDLRDEHPRRNRPLSIWSHLPKLGNMNTAEAVEDLYER